MGQRRRHALRYQSRIRPLARALSARRRRRQREELLEALEALERGHVVNAVAASREVDSRLRNLARPECDGMEAAARATIDSIVAVFRAQDEAYDERTRHGEAQGAVWPPRAGRNMRQPGPNEAIRYAPLSLPTTGP